MTAVDYRNGLRTFLKDFEEINRLLNFDEESSDDKLDLYLNMALGFMTMIPPPSENYASLAEFPMPSLLLHRAVIECLLSNSIYQARNELAYNNGGISVKFQDGARYLNMIQAMNKMMDQEIQMLQQRKIYLNIESGWGGLNSPYQYIAGYPYLIRPYNSLG